MPTPVEVKALGNYRLQVKYSDGVEGVVDDPRGIKRK